MQIVPDIAKKLTVKELRVCNALLDGHSEINDIARVVGCSPRTVKGYLQILYNKYHVSANLIKQIQLVSILLGKQLWEFTVQDNSVTGRLISYISSTTDSRTRTLQKYLAQRNMSLRINAGRFTTS